MIYVLAPSPGPTGQHRPEHESLDRGEDVFPIVLYDVMPKNYIHNHSSKWFTIDRIILYRKTDMGKSHPVIRASQMTPLTWQHLPVPVHLCKYVCMCEKCPVDNRWQQTAVPMSLSEGSNSRGHSNSQCLTPNPSTPPVWLWSDRVCMLAADVRQAHQIFRPWCKMLKVSCHFLRRLSLIRPGLMA